MAYSDLDLSFDGSSYALEDPTTDQLQRMRNRFRVQFLSCRKTDGRGCTFYTELTQGRVKTNSDIVSLFSLSAAEIISYLRKLQLDIYPNRVVLNDLSFPSNTSLALSFTIFSSEGSITDSIEVTT